MMSTATLRRLNQWTVSFLRTILLIGICFVILLPLINRLSTALMPVEDLYDQSVRWIPRNPTLSNFQLVWVHMEHVKAFTNSFLLALPTSVLQVPACTLVGYCLARFRFFNFMRLLGDNTINLICTYWPFILTSLTGTGFRNGLYIFIMRQFFRGMPRELEEAAFIDGAGLFRTFFRVMLPGSVPGLIV